MLNDRGRGKVADALAAEHFDQCAIVDFGDDLALKVQHLCHCPLSEQGGNHHKN